MENVSTLKAGDLVVLKSGSPKMTVEKIYWFGKLARVTHWKTDITSSRFGKDVTESAYSRFSTRELRVDALEKAA